ncbi:MAG: response regulator [Roseiflexaceae bacterium]|nr:response regulator [Roseiflexaceae bacterium]
MRVVIIEDSSVQAARLQAHLQQYGLLVEVIASGRQALKTVRANPPDVVVLDIELPDMNGYDICRTLKADPGTAQIPVVMLTMRDTHQDALDGLIYGAVDYIPKDAFAPMNLIVSLRSLGLLENSDVRG